MEEQKNDKHQNEIDNFIFLCRCNQNFKHGNNYFNAYKFYFENVIDTSIISKAIEYNLKFFVGRSLIEPKLIYIFIYKKDKNYEFDGNLIVGKNFGYIK